MKRHKRLTILQDTDDIKQQTAIDMLMLNAVGDQQVSACFEQRRVQPPSMKEAVVNLVTADQSMRRQEPGQQHTEMRPTRSRFLTHDITRCPRQCCEVLLLEFLAHALDGEDERRLGDALRVVLNRVRSTVSLGEQVRTQSHPDRDQ